MARNIKQVYDTNPITTNTSTDLMYFGQSPYGLTNDAAMTYGNFYSQQWGNLAVSTNSLISTNTNGNIAIIPNGTGSILYGNTTKVLANTLAQIQNIQVNQDAANAAIAYNSSGFGGAFRVFRSKSTGPGIFAAVSPGDILGSYIAYGDDGTQFTTAAFMEVQVDAAGTVSNGIVPGRIAFFTYDATGTKQRGMYLDYQQKLNLTNPLPVASGGTGISALGTGVATALGQNVNGTGSIALSASPTFTTPTLGVAAATSINFGQSALGAYRAGTAFTPTITYDTAGDLSVAYTIQTGEYWQIGAIYGISVTIRFTPTFTTASGNLRIASLPTSFGSFNFSVNARVSTQAVTFNAGGTQLMAIAPSSYFNIYSQGTGVASSALTTLNFISGVQYTLIISGILGV